MLELNTNPEYWENWKKFDRILRQKSEPQTAFVLARDRTLPESNLPAV
jgi:hypothetical protein